MNRKKPSNEHIRVFVRCRPLSKLEQHIPVPVEVHPGVNKILVKGTGVDKNIVKTFSFDRVFGPDAKQEDVYAEVVAPIIHEVIMGFNCTIFAYGQTGTGKTFTIEGGRSENLKDISEDPLSGIIPRSMKHLFSNLTEQNRRFKIHVSYLELYNEEIFDLLSERDELVKLRIFDSRFKKGSVTVQGLEELPVTSMEEVYSVLDTGFRKRRKAATLLNKCSSRSHTVFTVIVSLRESSSTFEEMKTGKLNLVDLAGSENIGRSGACNKRAREAGKINQSLLALGRVITSLCENAVHIPYRESNLTRLLQDSLGGQTKTAIIATISPSAIHVEETLNTLEYSLRAMNIANKPELNTQVTVTSLTKDYLEKIHRQRREIHLLAATKGICVPEEHIKHWESTLASKREEKFKALNDIAALELEHKSLKKTVTEATNNLTEKRNRLEALKLQAKEYQQKLQEKKKERELNEAMLKVMLPLRDDLHEQLHEDIKEKQKVDSELLKMKEKFNATVKQQSDWQEKLKNIREKLSKENEKLHIGTESLLKNISNSYNNVNSLTSKCDDYVSLLKNSFDSASVLLESEFKTLFKAISDFEEIDKSFQNNAALALNEDKSRKVKSIDEIYEVYQSSNDSAVFEPLNNTLEEWKSSLFEISSSVDNWKNLISSQMTNLQNLMEDLSGNQNTTLETMTDSVNTLLKKQKENLMEYNNIITECVNAEASSKALWSDQLLTVERAMSSLDLFCTEHIQSKIDSTYQASTCLKNTSKIQREISDKLTFCENSVESIEAAQKEIDLHASNSFSHEWEKMKKSMDVSRMMYKDLNTELARLSRTSQDTDELSKRIEDMATTKHFSENSSISTCFQGVINSNLECGNSYKTLLLENQTEMDALSEKCKTNMGELTDLSKSLATSLIQTVPTYIQHIEKDLKNNLEEDYREISSGTEGDATENDIYDGNVTVTAADCSEEPTTLNEFECPICVHTSDETLLCAENDTEIGQCSKNVLRHPVKKLNVQPPAKGFQYPIQQSPIRRRSSRYELPARRHLDFIEKLSQIVQSSSDED